MIVFPMGGLSSRFSKAGYKQPKWMLPLAGKTVFEWVVGGFSRYFSEETFVFAFRKDSGSRDYIADLLTNLGVESFQLVELEADTRGQADTVKIALDAVDCPDAEEITIFNIDTVRLNYQRSPLLETSDGWIEVLRAEGEHWSFVAPSADEEHRAIEVVEKKRISDLCSTGLYYFRSKAIFDKAFAEEERAPTMPELYVAPLYQRLIKGDARVTYSEITPDEVIFSGTPAEYEAAVAAEDTLFPS